MNVEKFYELLIKLYEEQENVKVEYELIFLGDKVSNS